MDVHQSIREILQRELSSRQAKNPSYSLRAFSNYLGLSHSHLSKVLRQQSTLTEDKAKAILRKTSPRAAELSQLPSRFCESIQFEERTINSQFCFAVIQEFLKISGKQTPAQIAEHLGFEESVVRQTIEDLLKSGTIAKTENGWDVVEATRCELKTQEDRKNYFLEVMKSKKRAFEKDSTETINTTLHMNLSEKSMEILKTEMIEFQKRLLQIFKNESEAERTYAIEVCTYPVSLKVESETKPEATI